MHWDHEPTPNPSQEGTGQDADECLLPSWEWSGVGRFMERENQSWPLRDGGGCADSFVTFGAERAFSGEVH